MFRSRRSFPGLALVLSVLMAWIGEISHAGDLVPASADEPKANTLSMERAASYLDEVALTLQRDDEIRAFQAADRNQRPWIHFAGKQP